MCNAHLRRSRCRKPPAACPCWCRKGRGKVREAWEQLQRLLMTASRSRSRVFESYRGGEVPYWSVQKTLRICMASHDPNLWRKVEVFFPLGSSASRASQPDFRTAVRGVPNSSAFHTAASRCAGTLATKGRVGDGEAGEDGSASVAQRGSRFMAGDCMNIQYGAAAACCRPPGA